MGFAHGMTGSAQDDGSSLSKQHSIVELGWPPFVPVVAIRCEKTALAILGIMSADESSLDANDALGGTTVNLDSRRVAFGCYQSMFDFVR
ncbi:MAG: hypothetical protein WB586_21465 [Chthoniobacterales bacterium]